MRIVVANAERMVSLWGLGIDRRVILCWILQEWNHLAENGEGFEDFENTVLNLRIL